MSLTFSPALRTTTALPVAHGGHGSFRFSASFSSRREYERAREEGTRLEIWTNLPVGSYDGRKWHALAFTYPEAVTKGADDNKVFNLATDESARRSDSAATVVLDLTLRNARPGAVYSFTYRLVRASGAIEWLGAYGQNGDLVLEEKDVRLSLAHGCEYEQGGILTSHTAADSVLLATLDKSVDWACWSFGETGCKGPYAGPSLPRSSAALLVPRPDPTRLVDVQPLFCDAGRGTLSITSNGDIILHGAARLAALDLNMGFFESLQKSSPASFVGIRSGFAVLANRGDNDAGTPSSLSLIAVSKQAWSAPSTDISLTDVDVRALLGSEHNDAVVFSASTPAFGTWKAGENLVIRVSAPGAQCILAPVYNLAASKDEASASLALVSPSASAHVEVIEEVQKSALLTPPPSPPAALRPVMASLVSTPISPLRSSPPPSILQVLPELSETSKEIEEREETVSANSTLTEPQETTTEETETDKDKEDALETPTSLVRPSERQPSRVGYLRFLLAFVAWLARPALEKMYGFFGSNILLWLACKFFGSSHSDSEVSTSKVEPVEEPLVEFVEDDAAAPVEPPAEPEEAGLPQRERLLLRTYSELTVSDGSTMICEAEEEEDQDQNAATPKVKVIEDIAPLHATLTPIEIPPRQPPVVMKPVLMVDARSDVVSLVAYTKASPELDVVVNGKTLSLPVESAQLSDEAYLLTFRLPSDSAKLRVAFRN